MCLGRKPKPQPQQQPAKEDPVPVLRNPYLDGIDPIVRSKRSGTKSFRIDRNGGSTRPYGTPSLVIQRSSRTPASL